MPAPNPRRDKVLKYLKTSFPHKEDLKLEGKLYEYEKVKEVVYSLRDCNPDLLRILNYYMFHTLSRTRIADEVGYDASTVKRYLDKAADNIMQRLNHGDFPPEDLFEVRHPVTGAVEKRPFPKTCFRND
jgi:DNA-directed RNA polymerase specialized sigma24 family protein